MQNVNIGLTIFGCHRISLFVFFVDKGIFFLPSYISETIAILTWETENSMPACDSSAYSMITCHQITYLALFLTQTTRIYIIWKIPKKQNFQKHQLYCMKSSTSRHIYKILLSFDYDNAPLFC